MSSSVDNGEETESEIMSSVDNGEETASSLESSVDNGEETALSVVNGEETMWCGHCGRMTPTRRGGRNNAVKSCNWCGKILADETGTAEEYNQRFIEYLILQNSVPHKRRLISTRREYARKKN